MAKKPAAKRPPVKKPRARTTSRKRHPGAAPARAGSKRISAVTSSYRVTSLDGAPGFPEVSGTQPPDQCRDINVLGRNAVTDAERHQVLDHAVTSLWAAAEISAIRRVESDSSHRWVMWLRSDVSPA